MLKTDVEHPARPATFLIALGVLRGYIRNPLAFLAGTVLTFPRFKKRLPRDLPREFVEVVALQTWFYMRLKAKVGKEKALEITRTVVLPAGLAIQQANFRAVEAPRTFENLVAYEQRTNREGTTRWNRVEILEQSDRRYEFRVHNCMFHDFFTRMVVPELTGLHCAIDNAILNSYLPEEVTFHRNGIGNRIADGAPACHFVLEHNPAKEQ